MNDPTPPAPSWVGELARFLEIQNLGLNLPFALAFLLVASAGHPTVRTTVLVLVAFVAARNAGHSFNRWADRDLDARNPRTQGRALVTGRISPRSALGFSGANAVVLVVAAYLLNPLALALVPVALALVLGYSLTKRVSAWTTVCLGLVEAITPAAVFVAVTGSLPWAAVVAAAALGCWGTAFETIHSLGDLEADRAAGTYSLPLSTGTRAAVAIVPALHLGALALFAWFGHVAGLDGWYFVGIAGMSIGAFAVDYSLARRPTHTRPLFRAHFALGTAFLLGVIFAFTL